MPDFSRRELIKVLLHVPLLTFIPVSAFARTGRYMHFYLPPKPFELMARHGARPGGRILVIGGIHGNEPGGYRASDVLMDVDVTRGSLLVVPRSNFTSILAFKRGYNGDMNRKFAGIAKDDPDLVSVERIKQVIRDFRPDVLLSLHDGYGFNRINSACWGQSVVIDSEEYSGFKLGEVAREVTAAVNRKIKVEKWHIPVHNTRTFDKNTHHPEQRKSLTYYSLTHCNTRAFCLEVSKQLPDLKTKVRHHLLMLEEFFKIYDVEISPDFDTLISGLRPRHYDKDEFSIDMLINDKKVNVKAGSTLRVPSASEIKMVSVNGPRGTYIVPVGVNLNWHRFFVRHDMSFIVKRDFERVASIRFVIV